MILGGLQKTTLIDFPGKVACTVFTSGCNFKCGYCHNPELHPLQEHIDEKDFFEFLKTRVGKLEGVVITGGEPTIHGDIIDFIREIKKLGYLVKLDTQGSLPHILERIIEEQLVDYVAMDIKAPLSKYALYTKIPNIEIKIQKSIDLVMTSSIDYEFRTTVVSEDLSFDDIRDIGKLISGAEKYYLQKFIPAKTLDPFYQDKTSYSEEDLDVLIKQLERYVEYCDIR
jgi:pyruvate formate lyase activating enzyme